MRIVFTSMNTVMIIILLNHLNNERERILSIIIKHVPRVTIF